MLCDSRNGTDETMERVLYYTRGEMLLRLDHMQFQEVHELGHERDCLLPSRGLDKLGEQDAQSGTTGLGLGIAWVVNTFHG
jgi:hypothetical protein